MKALSIRQPWAWLIVHGVKDVENRTWRTNFRGRFLVHAGMRFDEDGHRRIWAEAHASKALALYLTGHSKEAISAFEHAITLDPEQFGSHLFYGLHCRDTGQFDKAATHLARAAELSPRYPLSMCVLAAIALWTMFRFLPGWSGR
jgi:tetratricopeptide (TPR) repeat protein